MEIQLACRNKHQAILEAFSNLNDSKVLTSIFFYYMVTEWILNKLNKLTKIFSKLIYYGPLSYAYNNLFEVADVNCPFLMENLSP